MPDAAPAPPGARVRRTFDDGKITATVQGAFSTLQVGQIISIDNTAGGVNSNGIFTITAVSPDGDTITLDQNLANTGVEAAGTTATINLLVPDGTTLALSGSVLGNDRAHTVHWPTNAELATAGYAVTDGAPPQDGSTILISPQVFNPTGKTISFNSTAFLTGVSLGLQ